MTIGIKKREKVLSLFLNYSVERAIHGPDQEYNDINVWHYDKLVFIEVKMERLDVPELLRALGEVFAKQNAYLLC
ncbi:hypothetical protein [Scopulibacillus darangshiensis]|uniref:hypothetical protein n=1 Tax=Scopulibacillus darangshiensis TaxID=442528 RepID=UPI001404F42B|nr:hypothetical protein [Scopulibacillus darangshiensis]